MKKLIWLSPCLALSACAATVPTVSSRPATVAAAGISDASCSAGNYRYLLGRPVPDARDITDREYRIALGGAAATRASRVTLIYDPQTQRITEIRCG